MAEQMITPIGCSGACQAGTRPCTCIPDLDAETWGEPVDQTMPAWEVALFWAVVGTLAAVTVGGFGWVMGWWL